MPNEAPLSFEATAFQCFIRGLRGVWRDEAYRGTTRVLQTEDGTRMEVNIPRGVKTGSRVPKRDVHPDDAYLRPVAPPKNTRRSS